jgi:hypothetical protein
MSLDLTTDYEKNQDPIIIQISEIKSPVLSGKMYKLQNKVFLYYPLDDTFDDRTSFYGPLINSETAKVAVNMVYQFGPLVMFSHPSILMVIESVAFAKLISYFPLKLPNNVQQFVRVFASDKPSNMYGDALYSKISSMRKQSSLETQVEESLKFYAPKNRLFSKSMIYIKLVGYKIVGRMLINFVLIIVALLYWNKPIKFIKKKKFTFFLLKVVVNIGLILNFEIFQNDGKMFVLALTAESDFFEICVVSLDILAFTVSHYYLWTLFSQNKNMKTKVSSLKPFEKHLYKAVFVFQKEKSLKLTLLDNWSTDLFPVRLLDNLCFFARVLAIKLFQSHGLGFMIGFNLLNIAIFYVNIFKIKRKKYHILLVYFKIKWIMEFLLVKLISISYWS